MKIKNSIIATKCHKIESCYINILYFFTNILVQTVKFIIISSGIKKKMGRKGGLNRLFKYFFSKFRKIFNEYFYNFYELRIMSSIKSISLFYLFITSAL